VAKSDAPPPRRQSIGAKRNPETAEAIRAAALEILHSEGYAGFSVEKVAKRARAGKPTIYRWWPSRAALLLDVYHLQKSGIEYPVTDDIEDDLVMYLQSLFAHWLDGPSGDIFRSIMAEAQVESSAREVFLEYVSTRRERLAEMLAAPRSGKKLAIEATRIADLTISYAWMRLLTQTLDVPEKDIRLSVRCILAGAQTSI